MRAWGGQRYLPHERRRLASRSLRRGQLERTHGRAVCVHAEPRGRQLEASEYLALSWCERSPQAMWSGRGLIVGGGRACRRAVAPWQPAVHVEEGARGELAVREQHLWGSESSTCELLRAGEHVHAGTSVSEGTPRRMRGVIRGHSEANERRHQRAL